MIKVFKNHIYLCTFTTAILSLLQSGIGVCADSGRNEHNNHVGLNYSGDSLRSNNGRSRPRYDISVTPISSSGYTTTSSHHTPFDLDRVGIIAGNNVSIGYRIFPRGSYSEDSIVGAPSYNAFSEDSYSSNQGRGGHGYSGFHSLDSDRISAKPVSYGSYYACGNCGESTINDQFFKITNENVSGISSQAIAIKVEGDDKKVGEPKKRMTVVTGKNVTVESEIADKPYMYGVFVSKGAKIVLDDFSLKNAEIALYANEGTIEINKGIIENSQTGVWALGNPKRNLAHVVLNNTKITTNSGKASLYSSVGTEIKMKEGSVDFTKSNGVYTTLNGKVIFDKVNINGKGEDDNKANHAAFLMDEDGLVDFSNGKIDVTNVHGILSENTVSAFNSIPLHGNLRRNVGITEVNFTSSSVTVNGKTSYGMYFKGDKPLERLEDKENLIDGVRPSRIEVVNLIRTRFSVPDSTVVYSTDKTHGIIHLLQSSLQSWDSLLKVKNGAFMAILADASTLEGSTHVDSVSTGKLYLSNGSTWILQQKQKKNPAESVSTDDLSISFVTLMNSSINFKKLKSASSYDYQTLNIGKGSGDAYRALDDAQIYLNTYLNSGGLLSNQKTDRVLIHGDVAGQTTVRVRPISGSPGGYTGNGGNDQGISIIQVSGKADKNSFKLDGEYVALQGLPYQYRLYAYGPQSNLGEANSGQRLVKGKEAFWDFRLENKHIDSKPSPEEPKPDHDKPDVRPEPSPDRPDVRPEPSPDKPDVRPKPSPDRPDVRPEPSPHPDSGIKDVVPQVPTYLLLPNSLFHTGLISIGNQSRRLESLRTASGGLLKNNENPAFFVRGYGGHYRYISDLSVLKYGYGGDLDYSAAEAGILLGVAESAYSTTSFGVMGSYERFFLQPLDVEHSQKSTFNKWSMTGYGSIQYHTGFYVDGLLSYGLFKGDVLTLARGKTATSQGKILSTSLTVGEAFMTKYKGLVFDPQVQVVYQHLNFDKAYDIDNFDIDMGRLDQWVMRTGGRLIKTLDVSEEGRAVSFYGKLNLSNNLGKKQFVHFKDSFQLGDFGSSLEAGLGVNAQLSPKFAFYGDLIYQHKLTKAGFSGTSFFGGLRYHF
ncbi:autotransporter outer membrane beta-barrel domain-containing protein [Bartonella sp. B10]